jgi:hypothetical protein
MRKIAFSALAVLGSFTAACSGTPDAIDPIDADASELSVASDAYALPMLTSVNLGTTARTVGNVTVQDARNTGGAPITSSSVWTSALTAATSAGVAPALASNAQRLVGSPSASSTGALGDSTGLWEDQPVSSGSDLRANRPTVARWVSATPEEVTNQQDRGGRLACAFREATAKLNGARVAQAPWSAARLDFFGYPVDFMQVAPTVALKRVAVDHGASRDGVEGYVLPMDFGVQVTPLTNLGLPSLAEAVAPVTVLAADSMAVATRTVRNRMGIPTLERTNYSGYAEALRANAISRTTRTEPLPLFTISGIEARATLSATQYAGLLVDPAGLSFGALQSPTQAAIFGTNPRMPRDGWWAGAFDDGAMRGPCAMNIAAGCVQSGVVDATTPWTASQLSAPAGSFLSRVLQDDALNATVQSGARVDAALEVTGGFNVPYVRVDLSVSGGFYAKAFVDHVVGRGARIQQIPGTSSNAVVDQLVVRPRFGANAGLARTFLDFRFSMVVPFYGLIDWNVEVPIAGERSLADWTTDASPSTRRPDSGSLRLGIGSSVVAAATRTPVVSSQLPNQKATATFSSLPLATCLGSEPEAVAATPAPQPAKPTAGSAPSAELCAVSAFDNPNRAMVVRTRWAGLSPTECTDRQPPSRMDPLSTAGAACRAAWRTMLCAGRAVTAPDADPATATGGSRWAAGEGVQSRIVRTSNAADRDAFGEVMRACGAYAVELPAQDRPGFMRSVSQLAVCDANAVPRTMSIAPNN